MQLFYIPVTHNFSSKTKVGGAAISFSFSADLLGVVEAVACKLIIGEENGRVCEFGTSSGHWVFSDNGFRYTT